MNCSQRQPYFSSYKVSQRNHLIWGIITVGELGYNAIADHFDEFTGVFWQVRVIRFKYD